MPFDDFTDLLRMAIEFVDLPMTSMVIFHCGCLPEGQIPLDPIRSHYATIQYPINVGLAMVNHPFFDGWNPTHLW